MRRQFFPPWMWPPQFSPPQTPCRRSLLRPMPGPLRSLLMRIQCFPRTPGQRRSPRPIHILPLKRRFSPVSPSKWPLALPAFSKLLQPFTSPWSTRHHGPAWSDVPEFSRGQPSRRRRENLRSRALLVFPPQWALSPMVRPMLVRWYACQRFLTARSTATSHRDNAPRGVFWKAWQALTICWSHGTAIR